mgnify:CR=1 FL=1
MRLNKKKNNKAAYVKILLLLLSFLLPRWAVTDELSTEEFSQTLSSESHLALSEVSEEGSISDEVVKGSYQIKFGGWSEHYISGTASNYNFNESHDGIGLAFSEYEGDDYEGHYFNGYNYEIWYMKDSFYDDNLQISYGLFHRKLVDKWGITNIDVGLNFAAISRSIADIDTKTAKLNDHKRTHTLMLIPSLSLYTKHNIHFDFVFLPALPNVTDYSVLFFRAGFIL